MNPETHKVLDNPVWNALQTEHKSFALGTATINRYPENVLKLFGCENPVIANLNKIEPWVAPDEKLFLVNKPVSLPANWGCYARLDGLQMLCTKLIPPTRKTDAEIIALTENDRQELFELVNLVQPGYFCKDTPLLGDYFGIKQDGKLIAVAGERLRLTGYTEISAVCTHSEHTGKGYAQQLVAHLATKHFAEGNLPFLHLLTSNTRARNVYELLGFEVRHPVIFWGVKMKSN